MLSQQFAHAEPSLSLFRRCRLGPFSPTLDCTCLEASLAIRSLSRSGAAALSAGKVSFDAFIVVPEWTSLDSVLPVRSLLCSDFALLALDFLQPDIFSPSKSHARPGVFALTPGLLHLESLLSLHSLACLGPATFVLQPGRPGFTLFVIDFLQLGSSLSLHSFARPGAFLPVVGFASFGSFSSLRSTA